MVYIVPQFIIISYISIFLHDLVIKQINIYNFYSYEFWNHRPNYNQYHRHGEFQIIWLSIILNYANIV